jgi:hypothetical protein
MGGDEEKIELVLDCLLPPVAFFSEKTGIDSLDPCL